MHRNPTKPINSKALLIFHNQAKPINSKKIKTLGNTEHKTQPFLSKKPTSRACLYRLSLRSSRTMRLSSYLRTVCPSSFHFRMVITALRFGNTRLRSLLPRVSRTLLELFAAVKAAAFVSACASAEKYRTAAMELRRVRINIFATEPR